jgi:hypothetical protein
MGIRDPYGKFISTQGQLHEQKMLEKWLNNLSFLVIMYGFFLFNLADV